MGRRTLYWHIGLPHAARPVVAHGLEAHRGALEVAGLRLAATPEEVRLATHELLRTHTEAGLRRDDVEGRWARICDRVWQHKGVFLLSTPDLAAADKDQLALALDPLIGVEVHLVVTAEPLSEQLFGAWLAELRRGHTTSWETYVRRIVDEEGHEQVSRFWAGHELGEVLARWAWTIRPERVHVLTSADPARMWQQYAELVAAPAEVAAAADVPAYPHPAGAAVLRGVNRRLDRALPAGAARMLLQPQGYPAAPMPAADLSPLAARVIQWSASATHAGHDVRGNLANLAGPLVETGGEGQVARPRDRPDLDLAVDALAEALAQNARLRAVIAALETDNERLDRKRRKHKRRLRALAEQN